MSGHCEYRLLAVDVDGTLLNSQNVVPPQNREALRRAHAAGLKVVLCTGRCYIEAQPILDQLELELDAAVTTGGSVVCDARDGRVFDRAAIPLDLARELTGWYLSMGYSLTWVIDDGVADCNAYLFDGDRRHPGLTRWLEWSTCSVREMKSLEDAVQTPLRISLIEEATLLAELSPLLTQRFDGRLCHNHIRAPAYRLNVIESFAAHVNKWRGIEWLCCRWEIDPAHTIAIGDDVNDLAMLRGAGLGVAMGNAPDKVKAVADRVTAGHDEYGVAMLIDELLGSD